MARRGLIRRLLGAAAGAVLIVLLACSGDEVQSELQPPASFDIKLEGGHTMCNYDTTTRTLAWHRRRTHTRDSHDKLEESRASLDAVRIHLAGLFDAKTGAMGDAFAAFVTTIRRVDDANWDETIRVNLTGAHRSCKAVLPHMIEQHSGAIVTLGSISGQVGMAERAAYGPTKAGVIQYTRNLAVDYAPHGIRANCICPGFVLTDLVRPWLDSRPAEVRAQIEGAHPLGIGAPDDIAGVAWFLCSPDSRWITGTDLSVDGGFTCI